MTLLTLLLPEEVAGASTQSFMIVTFPINLDGPVCMPVETSSTDSVQLGSSES